MPARPVCATLAAVVLVLLPGVAQAAAPANDDFADARVVHVGDRVTGTLVDASLETGEPGTSSSLIDHTVWYRLTPTATERVRLDTCGGNPYSELDVFTGTSVGALTEVAAGDYGCSSGGRVYLDVIATATYYVRVSGYDWGAAIALTVARPQKPANDDFADAQPLGVPAAVGGTNVDATVESGEPDPIPTGSGHSVWYRFTPATTAAVTVSLAECANATPLVSTLAVYSGDTLGSLTEVGQFHQACGFRARLMLFPKAGTTYRIAVRGGIHTADAFTLSLEPDTTPPGPPAPAPPNPKCPFELAAPGSVTYSGTASGGGEVCLTLEPGFSGVSWFNLVNPPRDLCIPFAVERYVPPLAIVGRRFSARSGFSKVAGTFAGQTASGTFQAAIPPGGAGVCSGRVVNWTATTRATPPPSISDATAPLVRVRGATKQHPLRSGRLMVSVRCAREACSAGASARVAGVYLQSAWRPMEANAAKTLTLRLTARARRAIARAVRGGRISRTRVTVVALDAAGNLGKARRTLTLRR